LETFLTEERISALFSAIDVDQTDQITRENISDAFSKFGREVSKEEMDEIMESHDINQTGYIDKQEFSLIFA
jgi:Ca2+-binding EF-hand superfamily protein